MLIASRSGTLLLGGYLGISVLEEAHTGGPASEGGKGGGSDGDVCGGVFMIVYTAVIRPSTSHPHETETEHAGYPPDQARQSITKREVP